MSDHLEKGTTVHLPFGEEGIIKKYHERIWASKYDVKITKSVGFNKKGIVRDFLVREVSEKIQQV